MAVRLPARGGQSATRSAKTRGRLAARTYTLFSPKEIHHMIDKLRQRLGREEGFTLIELLVVIVIIGILLAIAVPSYLGFRDRANRSAAQSNLRQAIPSAEGYYSDNQSYVNMTEAATVGLNNDLRDYDSGLSTDVTVAGTAPTATSY